jgi:hypothetical protein
VRHSVTLAMPATDVEQRVLIDEFIEEVLVSPDYLDVKVHGAPPLHVRFQEVGLKESGFDRVGGPDTAKPDWRIQPWGQER